VQRLTSPLAAQLVSLSLDFQATGSCEDTEGVKMSLKMSYPKASSSVENAAAVLAAIRALLELKVETALD
jgi:hypothetical protein